MDNCRRNLYDFNQINNQKDGNHREMENKCRKETNGNSKQPHGNRIAFQAKFGIALVNKNWTQKTKFFSDSILSLDSSVLFTILSWC